VKERPRSRKLKYFFPKGRPISLTTVIMSKKLVIVDSFPVRKQEAIVLEKDNLVKKKKLTKMWSLEVAKTARSTCINCKSKIEKGEMRIGVITFYPHRNCKWIHFNEKCGSAHLIGACLERFFGSKEYSESDRETLQTMLTNINAITLDSRMPEIIGSLSVPMLADALTGRYNRFRAFRFGLPEEEKFTTNWNWRCFLATMLVCNTHETAMLRVTDRLFEEYPTPEALESWNNDIDLQKEWKAWMEKNDLRHAGKKIAYILKANKTIMVNHNGNIPNDRDELQKMAGVGRHVASVTMAWVHQSPEFGIDTHVERILKRWGYIELKDDHKTIEYKIKSLVPENQVGHFSRSFVDHGQQVCGYTPDCSNCYLKHSCPTAAKVLDW